MGLKQKTTQAVESVVLDAIKNLSDDEKAQVLSWSENALVIRNNNSLKPQEKIIQLSKLETSKVVLIVLTTIFNALKNNIWEGQSWSRRLGFVGLAGGMTFGGTGVGIATLGAGIGLPLMLLTAGGGVILGSVIEEVKKELGKNLKK